MEVIESNFTNTETIEPVGVDEYKETENIDNDDTNSISSNSTEETEEAEELKLLNRKLQMCIEEMGIKDNKEAVEKLVPYILSPEKITEIITEEDIFNLFVEKFKKLI
jgi:hypothetical protein